jgi:DNA-binding beta-propeller fold protein YncE|tara:strand:- start:2101 stop:3132 length:1032 start_codon:yes stop_codon:yes gene_type:complete
LSTQTKSPGFVLDYVKTIGIVNNGFNGRGFANPYDIVVDDKDRIFVLNRCDPPRASAIRVGICNLDEEYLGEFGKGGGTGDGQFIWVVAMALDSQDRLHITDEHSHRITTYSTSGEYLSHWGKAGAADGELNGPAGIAIDSSGDLFVVDQNNSRVQKFTADGKFIANWGSFGSGDGQFNLPWGAAVDTNDDVYVADWRNDRIQKFDNDGKFLASFGSSGEGEGQFRRPTSVAVDPEGFIYVADWGNERVQVLGPDGSFQLILKGEATISKWAAEYLASNPEEKAERDVSNLIPELPAHLNTPYHISSQTEPYFWGPVSVSLDGKGRLYVTETNRHRFQVFQKR